MSNFPLKTHRALLIVPLFASMLVFSAIGLLQIERPAEAVPAAARTVPKYTASIADGRVAIYRTGSRFPMEITEVAVDTLPLADREALEAGIPLFGDEALAHLLEDYS